jgi:iron complex outermembrane recepter protein
LKLLMRAWLLVALAVAVCAQEFSVDLAELSLEELMDIEVFSVSRKEGKLSESAAAVFVLTAEDVRRTGATSIPEALRMVPGMEVARIDASKWAVSSRGFNDAFANKLLVLIDGRSVYSPLFSGVFWDTQDVPFEDVERIEVIRGPGATLWGANAVNGIINVLSKNARDTQGGLATVGLGSQESRSGSVRYGGRLGDDLYYRLNARRVERDDFALASGEEAADGWEVRQVGFRVDWTTSKRDELTLQGDLYDGTIGATFQIIDSPTAPYRHTFDFETPISGGNLLGRWKRKFSADADLMLQVYYDRTERGEAPISGNLDTWDLDFQHRFALDDRQEIVWGAGYRLIRDDMEGSFTVSFEPSSRRYDLFSAFVQEEIRLAEDLLRLTLGSKFEHSDFSGTEIQPNIRLLWLPGKRHTAWAGVSRAVRAPARSDHDIRSVFEVVPPGQLGVDSLAIFAMLQGNVDFRSETMVAFEGGYRTRFGERLFVDLATFYNIYDKLLTVEPSLPILVDSPASPYLLAPAIVDNRMGGRTYGAELSVDFQLREGFRLRSGYTLLKMKIDLDEDSAYEAGVEWEGVSPQHQFSLRPSLSLPRGLELDLWGRYVGDLPDARIDGYFDLDARLGWQVSEGLEIDLVAQDLLEKQRTEFLAPHSPTLNSQTQRGAYGTLRWKF